MAFENKSDFEFRAKGAEIENVPRSETDIKRLYFYTEDTPKGQVTIFSQGENPAVYGGRESDTC
jgi:hypothetical protein